MKQSETLSFYIINPFAKEPIRAVSQDFKHLVPFSFNIPADSISIKPYRFLNYNRPIRSAACIYTF